MTDQNALLIFSAWAALCLIFAGACYYVAWRWWKGRRK